ncbi:MAG TPA: hypothetical protein VHL98_09030 [Microvirga sp.]|jgi:hypothetical protein|nr:hypothetical protein [Microvirga sp.]
MIRADRDRRLRTGLIALAASLTLAAGKARAEAPASPPLQLKVRPLAPADALSPEARARQERLEARMRQNEFLFRSICRTCSDADRFDSAAPFHPHEVLRGPPAGAVE